MPEQFAFEQHPRQGPQLTATSGRGVRIALVDKATRPLLAGAGFLRRRAPGKRCRRLCGPSPVPCTVRLCANETPHRRLQCIGRRFGNEHQRLCAQHHDIMKPDFSMCDAVLPHEDAIAAAQIDKPIRRAFARCARACATRWGGSGDIAGRILAAQRFLHGKGERKRRARGPTGSFAFPPGFHGSFHGGGLHRGSSGTRALELHPRAARRKCKNSGKRFMQIPFCQIFGRSCRCCLKMRWRRTARMLL